MQKLYISHVLSDGKNEKYAHLFRSETCRWTLLNGFRYDFPHPAMLFSLCPDDFSILFSFFSRLRVFCDSLDALFWLGNGSRLASWSMARTECLNIYQLGRMFAWWCVYLLCYLLLLSLNGVLWLPSQTNPTVWISIAFRRFAAGIFRRMVLNESGPIFPVGNKWFHSKFFLFISGKNLSSLTNPSADASGQHEKYFSRNHFPPFDGFPHEFPFH